MFIRISLLAYILMFAAQQSVVAAEYRVYRSQLQCVRENAQKYLNLPGDILTIVLPACPIADPLEAFRSLANNNAFKREDSDKVKADAILRIERSKFQCLLRLMDENVSDPLIINISEACSR